MLEECYRTNADPPTFPLASTSSELSFQRKDGDPMMHPNEREKAQERDPGDLRDGCAEPVYGARERMNTGERTVYEIIHALQKHSICMAALMLHRH